MQTQIDAKAELLTHICFANPLLVEFSAPYMCPNFRKNNPSLKRGIFFWDADPNECKWVALS